MILHVDVGDRLRRKKDPDLYHVRAIVDGKIVVTRYWGRRHRHWVYETYTPADFYVGLITRDDGKPAITEDDGTPVSDFDPPPKFPLDDAPAPAVGSEP